MPFLSLRLVHSAFCGFYLKHLFVSHRYTVFHRIALNLVGHHWGLCHYTATSRRRWTGQRRAGRGALTCCQQITPDFPFWQRGFCSIASNPSQRNSIFHPRLYHSPFPKECEQVKEKTNSHFKIYLEFLAFLTPSLFNKHLPPPRLTKFYLSQFGNKWLFVELCLYQLTVGCCT